MIGAPKGRAPIEQPCPICGDPMVEPVRDHCHECDHFISWVCGDCNKIMTRRGRSIADYWQKVERYHAGHICPVRLFDPGTPNRAIPQPSTLTRAVHFSNGGGDGRYYRAAIDPAMWTCEQLAAALGVNANTAREVAQVIGTKIGTTWMVPVTRGLEYVKEKRAA